MNENIISCQKCGLCKNQPPLLDIKKKSQVMWVGLSAKKKTDEKECPLSSITNSGRLIQQIEEAYTDSTLVTYRTNLVKCLPLDSKHKLRYPNKTEIDACFSNLITEIDSISPKIVFLLGKNVYSAIDRHFKLSFEKWDGYNYCYKEKSGIYYVPIHHPSYIHVYKRKEIDEYIAGVIKIITELL